MGNTELFPLVLKCSISTDIRDNYTLAGQGDYLELPAGIWWQVQQVFPIALGFPNAHLGVTISRAVNQNTGAYPTSYDWTP